jgi:hypothetical protein
VRFDVDGSWQRFGPVVIAGSPLTIFRLTEAGTEVVDTIERGGAVKVSKLTERMLNAGAIHPVVASQLPAGRVSDTVTVVTPQLGGVAHTDGRITVDDGSQPPIAGAALRLEDNRGPAAARNAARSMVRTDFVAFVDADVDVDRDGRGPQAWMRPLLAHFDNPSVGLVAPRVLGEPGSALDMGAEPARIRAGTRVSYVPTAAVIARVTALDDVGWFDEGLRFGEDVDLVWRLDEAGSAKCSCSRSNTEVRRRRSPSVIRANSLRCAPTAGPSACGHSRPSGTGCPPPRWRSAAPPPCR